MFVCPECGLAQAQGGPCPADGTALAPQDDPILGTSVGAYRISRLLGVGGMGRVYKGVHPQIGSRVAVKVLSRECADRPELVERFFSEARAVNLIRHESIVNVLDLSRLPDGRPFIIMEYLDGAPLNDIVEKAGPLPLGGLARLATEVLDALGAAHAKGIVHRDLKPDNIFVSPAGHPKVLDFGIAKLRPEMGGSYTQTGSLLGTPHYMSPEQATGKPIDHRTDIYAMGVILFECATGRKPFNAESLFDLLRQHVDVSPPMPRTLRPDMPPALEQVILASLAKDPNARFGSAGALAQALQAATAGLGPEAWVPISPATAHRMSAQRAAGGPMTAQGMTPSSWPPGWSPSMGGTAPGMRPGEQGMQGMPMGVSGAPGMMMPQPGGNLSTATSGQVVPQAGGAKKGKGLWIGLGAVVVIGAIVVIAVAAGGGDGGSSSSGGGGGSTSASAGTGSAPPGSGSGTATVVAKAGGGGSSSGKSPTTGGSSGGTTTGSSGGTTTGSGGGTTTGSSGGTTTGTGTGTGSSGTQIATDPPPDDYHGGPIALDGYDPTKFDLMSFYPAAEAEAKKIWPDAKLWRIDAQGVYPDGKANVTLADNWEVMYRFISPKHSEPPPGTPMGVKKDENCVIYVDVEKEGIRSHVWSWDCKEEKLIRAPRCTPAQVWAKAIKLGAPAKNAVAELGYRSDFDGNVLWYFDIGDNFSQSIPDNC